MEKFCQSALIVLSTFFSIQTFAQPVKITIPEAMATVISALPVGEYVGSKCKVTVQRAPLSNGREYIEIRVAEQQPDGSYDLYHAGAMYLSTSRIDVLSISKDVSANALSVVLQSQGAMDSNGPADPAWIVTDSLLVTADTVTMQSTPKPAYSCKIR